MKSQSRTGIPAWKNVPGRGQTKFTAVAKAMSRLEKGNRLHSSKGSLDVLPAVIKEVRKYYEAKNSNCNLESTHHDTNKGS